VKAMAKGRFGGDAYKPSQLGPEPAAAPAAETSVRVAPSGGIQIAAPTTMQPMPLPAPASPGDGSGRMKMLSNKVIPLHTRLSPAASQKLTELVARSRRSATDLVDEALWLLFAKYP